MDTDSIQNITRRQLSRSLSPPPVCDINILLSVSFLCQLSICSSFSRKCNNVSFCPRPETVVGVICAEQKRENFTFCRPPLLPDFQVQGDYTPTAKCAALYLTPFHQALRISLSPRFFLQLTPRPDSVQTCMG